MSHVRLPIPLFCVNCIQVCIFIVSVPTISYKGKISFPKEMIPLPPVAASADMCYNKPI